MDSYLFENPFDLEENPRRKRRKKGRRKARRSNPANPARRSRRRRKTSSRRRSNPTRRRSRSRRRSSGGRRRNPFGIRVGGGGITGTIMQGAGIAVGVLATNFATAVLTKKVPFFAANINPKVQGLLSIGTGLGFAWLLKRFGGPLRPFAKSVAIGGIVEGIGALLPVTGGGLAQRFGLGQMGLGDFAREQSFGDLPSAAQRGILGGPPQLYGRGMGDFLQYDQPSYN